MTVGEQFQELAIFILIGMCTGFALDTFRRLSQYYRRKVLFIYTNEIFFWLLMSASFYLVLWHVNYGVVRLYYIVAIFIGLYLYYLVIHTYAQKVIKLGLSVMEKIIMLIYQITIYPLTLLIRFLVKGVYRITIGKFIGIIRKQFKTS